MTPPKLSIYMYLFNARKRDFDLEGTVANFCAFADEVVCATIKSEDDTLERLKAEETARGADRFRVVETAIQLSDNRFDGKLKTAAYKACTASGKDAMRIYVIADADERFPLSQRDKWREAAAKLFTFPHIDGWMIPVVDLYGDETKIKDDTIGVKFRMHKDTVAERGVIADAELGDGLFRTEISDSTEPKDINGNLSNFDHYIRDPIFYHPQMTSFLDREIFVLHYGFLDLARRAKINGEFWKDHWEKRSGHPENVVTEIRELQDVRTIKHKLTLT